MEESAATFSWLENYYRPLISYALPEERGGLCSSPLWRWRQINFEAQGLMKIIPAFTENDEGFLLKLTLQNAQTRYPFSKLSREEKKRLIGLACKRENAGELIVKPKIAVWSMGLLVSLLIKDPSRTFRKIVQRLLETGDYEGPLPLSSEEEIVVKLKTDPDLLQEVYLDFSEADLTGLENLKLDFSGQSLKGVQAERLQGKGLCFRYACLEGACFKEAELIKTDFTGAQLWGANFIGASLKQSTFHYANVAKGQFQKVKAKKSQWEGAHLFQASLVGGDFTAAVLEKSDVTTATFDQAVFSQASLENSQGLSFDQLDQAGSLEELCLQETSLLYQEDRDRLRSASFIKKTWDDHFQDPADSCA